MNFNDMGLLNPGVSIMAHSLCKQTSYPLVRCRTGKRRFGFRRARRVRYSALRMGNMLFLHPDMIERLKREPYRHPGH